MPLFQALILGLVQGLTEFIPVSSSGHLVVVPALLGWDEPSVAFDTILHLGTLLAVLVFFWREWWRLLTTLYRALAGIFSSAQRQKINRGDARLLGLIIIGTIPALIVGYLFQDQIESIFSSLLFVTFFFLITGVLLTVVELFLNWRQSRARTKNIQTERKDLSWGGALLVGIMQALAVLPGLSRSGLTISGGIFSGLNRERAARFSFLLSAPVILAAGALGLLELHKSSLTNNDLVALIIGFAVAAISGWLAIDWLLKFLRRRKLYIFSIYLVVLSLLIIWLAKF